MKKYLLHPVITFAFINDDFIAVVVVVVINIITTITTLYNFYMIMLMNNQHATFSQGFVDN